MNRELIFILAQCVVVPAWWLLTFAPNWKWTSRLVLRIWIPGLIACGYTFLLLSRGPRAEGADQQSLNGLVNLFSNPEAVLIAWMHFLAFDLFVGMWIVNDSRRLKIKPLIVAPCLVLTFSNGPLGLLLYFALRYGLRRQAAVSIP